MSNATISCAAIRAPDGKVYSVPKPGRHYHVILLMASLGMPTPIRGEQGFLLSDGRFVGREEAKLVAEAAGQMLPGRGKLTELFSEDIW
jgi:hypothetical protein